MLSRGEETCLSQRPRAAPESLLGGNHLTMRVAVHQAPPPKQQTSPRKLQLTCDCPGAISGKSFEEILITHSQVELWPQEMEDHLRTVVEAEPLSHRPTDPQPPHRTQHRGVGHHLPRLPTAHHRPYTFRLGSNSEQDLLPYLVRLDPCQNFPIADVTEMCPSNPDRGYATGCGGQDGVRIKGGQEQQLSDMCGVVVPTRTVGSHMRCEVAQVIQGAPASVVQGQQCLQGPHAGVKQFPAVVTLIIPAVKVQ
ncbi:hypothetical protein E2C01_007179 [Portunus trituberculatus]|uniref:Uncharacterized protein n=1 Tax=Portunus trituberculatus TaxID=210409 RepID=A0A5B7D081_PORTR|nr:hypothetical protein [Portunus trituberculatus]